MTLLYHYTARNRLDSILTEGLTKGDVPTSPTEGLNAVWLTSDLDPRQHGLGEARALTDAERYAMQRWNGYLPPVGARFDDKREVRITVSLAADDPLLVDWQPWAIANLDRQWRRVLSRTGGGIKKTSTWRIYFGVIPPSAFERVEVLKEAGRAARREKDARTKGQDR